MEFNSGFKGLIVPRYRGLLSQDQSVATTKAKRRTEYSCCLAPEQKSGLPDMQQVHWNLSSDVSLSFNDYIIVPKLPKKIPAFYGTQSFIVGHLMLKGRTVLFLFRVEYIWSCRSVWVTF